MAEFKRWYEHVYNNSSERYEPAMCLAPVVSRQQKNAFVICLSSAHMYREPEYMSWRVGEILALLDMEFTSNRAYRLACLIEDGLDQLVRMKPMSTVYDDKPKVLGEGELFVDGRKECSFDVTDKGLMN